MVNDRDFREEDRGWLWSKLLRPSSSSSLHKVNITAKEVSRTARRRIFFRCAQGHGDNDKWRSCSQWIFVKKGWRSKCTPDGRRITKRWRDEELRIIARSIFTSTSNDVKCGSLDKEEKNTWLSTSNSMHFNARRRVNCPMEKSEPNRRDCPGVSVLSARINESTCSGRIERQTRSKWDLRMDWKLIK